ncbi:ATP-binding protein [Tractidigestivibacter sp.]|uniref:sensor histidine kinase n=1 Tax=Tractidigestivibacter sp. TaxID=2847320 RepID=UPI002A908DC6|nr:ATP-binding protein [Tractidigestivibacter sp.]MDY5272285.1 ATP-binding protein [Tractidigestivibacter sp.]
MGREGRGGGGTAHSLRRSVFVSFAVSCSVVAAVLLLTLSMFYRSSVLNDAKGMLARECASVAASIGDGGGAADEIGLLSSIDFGEERATLVAPDGTVLYDSLADAATLENHAGRPEVAEAFQTGEGESDRASDTLGYVSLYHARRLPSGDVVRLGLDRSSVGRIVGQGLFLMVIVVGCLVVVAWFVSRVIASRLVRPILEIDPEAEDAKAPYVELEPLVSRLNEQHHDIIERMDQVQSADDMRREFTANVTHELKTPIAAISGASELIRDGIVRPEDIPNFAGRIYDDAQRLSALVSDILTLSKLDETERTRDRQMFGSVEDIDLLSVASDVCQRYGQRARDAGVRLRLDGVSTTIRGNARLLDEMVGNLVSNSIRYNRQGGSVFVWVLPQAGKPCVRVSDTGIGIPQEDQAKVFERFYRVDKGRSRERGGTGLGLAIVKHAVAFHDATIDLKSELGKGTQITVTFP